MRWATSLAAAALLFGCGNFSTDDLEFLEAMPTRDLLQVELPGAAAQAATAGAQAAVTCGPPLGEAATWTGARAIGMGVNAGLDWILRVVDHVRAVEPTRRERDRRTWGPFPDRSHPGVESRIVVWREFDTAGTPTYHFAFEGRRPALGAVPGGDWLSLIDGAFVGAYARTGRGEVTLRFGSIRTLGANDDPGDPANDVLIRYDRRGDPRWVSLTVPGNGGFGLIDFPYTWSVWSDGEGRFDYAAHDPSGNRIVTSARYTAAGAGRGDIVIYPASGIPPRYGIGTCWDEGGCYTAVDDPFNVARICAAPATTCVVAGPCPTVRP